MGRSELDESLTLRFRDAASEGRQGRMALIAIALVSVLAVAAAMFTQQVWDMQPCPWCILQRMVFVLMALVAVLALVLQGALRRVVAGLIGLLALGGVGAALWQHFVAAASSSCNLTAADRVISGLGLDALWPQAFGVFASCADAKVNLVGVPYEFWSLALFVVLGGLALGVALRR